MDRAMADPKAPQQELVVTAKFFTYENIDTWVEGGKRGYTLDNFPLEK
jgi:ribose transport system substrate-binding protein